MNSFLRKSGIFAIVFVMANLFFAGGTFAQTVFNDPFTTSEGAGFSIVAGPIGTSSTWSLSRSGPDWGARIDGGLLALSNDGSGTANANGWMFAYTSSSNIISPFNSILSSNTGVITWTLNMRQIRADPAGFAIGSYGVAYILSGNSTTANNGGNGYAVVLGNSGATDPIKLVKYNNGLQGTVTDIITSNTAGLSDFGADYLSIRVRYTPSTNNWELFLRNDGASAFADPATGTLISQGNAVDATYTGTSFSYMGAYWQGSTGANQSAVFDNVSVTSAPAYTGGGNIVNGGVNFVGRINVYSQPVNCTGGDYRVLNYRRVSATSGTPTDGRGQWVTTVNVQSSGGNVTPDNMPGGGGAGFLFTSGGECGNTGTFANKWNFGGVGQAGLDAVNGSNLNASTDMGLNMGTAGRYTFVMKDVYSTNGPAYYVGFTNNAPVTIMHTVPAQQTVISYNAATITATLSAAPSSQEKFYLRYRATTNDLSTATAQVLGSVSGTTVTFNLTGLSASTTYYYYVLSTTHGNYTSLSEVDKSLSILNYTDNIGTNYSLVTPASYTITASAGANGSITPSGVTTVASGGGQAYTIAANSGFYIADVLINGASNATAKSTGSYTFSNVTANQTISATFAPLINYVYHEATTNNPGCGPNYRSVLTPNSSQSMSLSWKIEYQNYWNQTRVYYTTDNSAPSGAFGIASGTTQVLTGVYNCGIGGSPNPEVAIATIPVQPAGTIVKYIISAWNTNGGGELFASSGNCTNCGAKTTAAAADVYTYTVTQAITEVDYANLQFPPNATINTGGSANVFAQVYEAGVTDASTTIAGAGITAWIGVNASNTDPSTWLESNWTLATFNPASAGNNNDEYQAAIGATLNPGTYFYASRFQLTGGPYKYGGYFENNTAVKGGFWGGQNVSGVLTVNCTTPTTPTILASGVTTFCTGGSITLTSSALTGNTWSTGATTQSITVSSSGNYSVTYKDAFGCTATSDTVAVTVNPIPATPTISSSGSTTFCQGGSVTLTSSNPSGNIWSNGETTESIVVSTAGSYSVKTTVDGCDSATSAPTTVTVNSFGSALTVFTESMGSVSATTSISAHETANGFDNDGYTMTGTADVRTSTPSSGYAESSGNANVFITGTQNFQIEGINTLGLSNLQLTFGILKTTTASNGNELIIEISTDGSSYSPIAFTALPTGSGTAIWSQTSTSGAIPAAANLRIRFRQASGTVQFRIDDVKLTGSTTTAAISQTNGCGTATLTASAGSSYLWSNGSTNQSITVSNTGDYSVTVTGSNGCTSNASISVTNIPTALTASVTAQTNVSCNGGANGTVTAAASGGTGSYSYTIAGTTVNTTGATSGIFTGLAVGLYIVTAKDATNCTASTASVTISQPDAIVASAVVTAPLCFGGNGNVEITAIGGTGTLTGIGPHLVAAGAPYSFTITDANGCSSNIISGTMSAPTEVVASSSFTPILCNGDTSTITVKATGGTGSYTGTGSFTVNAGPYSYTVTDANGCASTTTGTIAQPSVITLTEVQTNVSCNAGNNGAIDLTVLGGTPSEIISVSENFDGLASSGLSNTWVDGTTIANWFTWNSVANSSFSTYAASNGTTTAGLNSYGTSADRALGTLVINATGAILGAWKITNTKGNTMTSITVNYTGEQWRDNGNSGAQSLAFDYQVNANDINASSGWTVVSALEFVSPIHSGSSSVLDGNAAANRSAKTATFAVSIPPGQSIWLRWRDANDTGNDHALAIDDLSATLKGATATPYTYLWSNGATTQDVSTLTAGEYTVTVKDANNCEATKTVTISEPAVVTLSATSTDVSCNGGSDGTITATSNGTVVIKNSSDVVVGSTGLPAGIYTLTATNPGNNSATCSATPIEITISEPVAVTLSATSTDVSCNSGSDGTITATSNGTVVIKNSSNEVVGVTGLPAGIYTLTATNPGNNAATCPATPIEIIISEPDAVTLGATSTDVSCNGGSDGTITATSNGAVVIKNSNNEVVGSTGLPAGTYTLTATNPGNNSATCSATPIEITISEPDSVTLGATSTDVSCNGGSDGTISATSNGTVVIKNSSNAVVGTTGLPAGTYTLTATNLGNNAATCSATPIEITITEPDAVTLSATSTDVSCNGGSDGTITATSNGAVVIKNSSNEVVGATGLPAGNYTLTATKTGNNVATCSATPIEITITEPAAVTLSATSTNVSCNGGSTGTITATSNGTVVIKNSSNAVVGATGLPAGTYTVTATNPGNNSATCNATPVIVIITQPSTAVTSTFSTNNAWLYFGYSGDQSATIKAIPSGGTGNYTVEIKMSRALKYNSVNSTGDELWTASGGATTAGVGQPLGCSTALAGCDGSGLPTSTWTNVSAGSLISVNVSLMQDATFTVKVTDANGCEYISSVLSGGATSGGIDAEDVRCFAGNSNVQKVTICHRTGSTKNPCVTICVDANAIEEHLAHGDYMGNCQPLCKAPVSNAKQIEVEVVELNPFKVTAYPNPSSSQFTLLVEGGQNEKVEVLVYDMMARMVKRIEKTDGQPILFGEELPRGEYLTIVKQGENMKAVNVIKQ